MANLKRASIPVAFSDLARILGEDRLWPLLAARGRRVGSSIIIAAEDILPVLYEALKEK